MDVYKAAQQMARQRHNFTPKPCWIAHIRRDSGKVMRLSHNRKSPSSRVYPCPDDWRRTAIIAILAELDALGPVPLAGESAT